MNTQNLFYVLITALLAWMIAQRFLGKVAPAKAKELVAAGAKLVDVRTPGEFAGGHIPGAINVPVGELASRIKDVGDAAKPVVVYCASGMRSAHAKRLLVRAGFRDVHDLGGITRWPG
jgi:phage shock protein E